jgi:predicted alpha-1,6-mannanase (GH76 family)
MGVFGAANGDGDDGASMVITIKFLRKEIEKKEKDNQQENITTTSFLSLFCVSCKIR